MDHEVFMPLTSDAFKKTIDWLKMHPIIEFDLYSNAPTNQRFPSKKYNKFLTDEFKAWLKSNNIPNPEITVHTDWTMRLRFANVNQALLFRMWL